jgi:hypothetical protein
MINDIRQDFGIFAVRGKRKLHGQAWTEFQNKPLRNAVHEEEGILVDLASVELKPN